MDLLQLAAAQNPWWRGEAANLPSFQRDLVEELESALAPGAFSQAGRRRAVVVSGLRHVGKTTALRQLAARLARTLPRPTDVLYFDVGDPRAAGSTLEAVLEGTGYATSLASKVLLFDEVGHDPAWAETVKRLVDLGEQAPALAVADSAAATLRASVHGETAVGRRLDVTLEPLSFAEVARWNEMLTELPADADAPALGLLADEYLTRGGLTEGLSSGKTPLAEWHARVRSDAELGVLLDVPRVRQVRDLEALRRVWRVIARGASLAVNLDRIASEIQVSRPTVRDLVDVLADVLLVRRLEVHGGGALAPIRHPARLVVADSGIAAAHLTPAELQSHEQRGRLVEVAMCRHLAELTRRRPGSWLGYHRPASADGGELDFAWTSPDGRTTVVEAKYGPLGHDERVIRRIAARAGAASASRALLVTRHPVPSRRHVEGVEVVSMPLYQFLAWPALAIDPEAAL